MLTLSLVSCATTPPPEAKPPPLPAQQPRGSTNLYSLSPQLDGLTPTRSWQTLLTPSFAVYYFDRAVAERLARAAERERARLVAAWGVSSQPWRPRCQVAIYNDTKTLVAMTGGGRKLGEADTRAARLTPGKTISRRITVAADDVELLSATLPHEISHVITGQIFGTQRVPLWANEGMAMLAESEDRHRRWEQIIRGHRDAGTLLALSYLLGLREYPANKNLFYAQSLSVTRYLITRGGTRRLLAFVRANANKPGSALQLYGMATLSELEQAWRSSLR